MYADLKMKVTQELSAAATICLMFDGWTDKYNARHFLGIRASYIKTDWTSGLVTLSCKPSPQDSQGVSEHILNELKTFGLDPETFKDKKKILFTAHDGAAAMMKTSRLLKSEYCQHCSSHSLHLLIMTDAVNKIPELKDLINRCKDVVTKLHYKGDVVEHEMLKLQSAEMVDALVQKVAAACNVVNCESSMPLDEMEDDDKGDAGSVIGELGIKTVMLESGEVDPPVRTYRRLRQEVVTRWNSALEMMSSLLSLKEEVNEALKRTGHYDMCIKATEWNVISQLCKLLMTFKDLTEVASGSIVGLSVIPLIRAKIKSACVSDASDCDEVALLKTKILSCLDKRFPMTDVVKIASLLDPASKNKKYIEMSLDDKRALLMQAAKLPSTITASTSTDSSTPVSSSDIGISTETGVQSKRLKLMDEFEDEICDDDLFSSVTQYLSSTEKHSDPLDYWRNSNYTSLAALAHK